MIQPISQNIGRCPTFKKTSSKYNPLVAKEAEKINTEKDFYQKTVEQNERMILINGILTIGLLAGTFIYNVKTISDLVSTKSKKYMPANIKNFKTLQDDVKIPTIETCKSINKDLKSFLQRQINHERAGIDMISSAGNPQPSNRLLLYGPAGVGKSYFAKIYAKSIDAKYMEVMFSDVNSMWAGEGVDNLKKVFENILKEAKQNPHKKYVVTFNEIDAIVAPAEKMNNNSAGSHWISKMEERSVFLNYMEVLKDETPNVTIIGTTNISPKNNGLDNAAMSRFQNLTEVPYPDQDCLYEALKTNLNQIDNKDKFFAENEKDLKELAQKMANRKFSFRNLEYIVNDAKEYSLDNNINGKNEQFTIDYLKKAEEKLKISDGELNNRTTNK